MQRRRSKGKSDGIHEARLRGNDRHQRDTFYMGALPPTVGLSPVESESEGGRGGSMVEDAEGRVRRRGQERLSCVSRHGKGVPLALGDACA